MQIRSSVPFCIVLSLLSAPAGAGLRGQTPEGSATAYFASPPPRQAQHSALRVALYTVGGAVVGGWTGYVGAQVVWSDWRNEPGRSNQRLRFSVAGAAIGMVAGLLIGTRAPAAVAPVPAVPVSAHQAITESVIRASAARSLTQLLREVRPQWLRARGVDVLTPSHDRLQAAGVRVYLNGELLGGLDTLDEVSIDAVTRIEFYDAGAAVLRWGAGNEDGAILLTTQPEE